MVWPRIARTSSSFLAFPVTKVTGLDKIVFEAAEVAIAASLHAPSDAVEAQLPDDAHDTSLLQKVSTGHSKEKRPALCFMGSSSVSTLH
ncbi:hypothetical protein ACLOJK_025166 [Asimina triloba]